MKNVRRSRYVGLLLLGLASDAFANPPTIQSVTETLAPSSEHPKRPLPKARAANSASTGPVLDKSAVPAAAVVAKPSVSLYVGAVSVSGGPIENASRVVAGLRSTATACWDWPTPMPKAGTSIPVRLALVVNGAGKVEKVSTSSGGGLTKTTLACLVEKFGQAEFSARGKGTATVTVPITFKVK